MLHFTVLSNTTWEWKRQGRWQCLINMGLRYSPNVHSLPIVCQVQEFPCVYCGDMAVLRKSVEQLKFVSSVRKPSRDKNFVCYKLRHECWYDNPKDQMDEPHTGRSHS